MKRLLKPYVEQFNLSTENYFVRCELGKQNHYCYIRFSIIHNSYSIYFPSSYYKSNSDKLQYITFQSFENIEVAKLTLDKFLIEEDNCILLTQNQMEKYEVML